MPLYGQVCKTCGHQFDDHRSMAQCENQPPCPKCGHASERDYGSMVTQCRPEQESDAMGIHPSQIPEAVARFPHHRYNKRGQMLFKTNAEMQRALKDLGYADFNRH